MLTMVKSVTQLLRLAHEAMQTLTAIRTTDSESDVKATPNRREAFEASTSAYIEKVHHVDIHLKRQILALEEAGIIPSKLRGLNESLNTRASAEASNHDAPSASERGTGKLDVGWLNSRSGKVERDMEAALWKKARAFLEEHNERVPEATDAQAD